MNESCVMDGVESVAAAAAEAGVRICRHPGWRVWIGHVPDGVRHWFRKENTATHRWESQVRAHQRDHVACVRSPGVREDVCGVGMLIKTSFGRVWFRELAWIDERPLNLMPVCRVCGERVPGSAVGSAGVCLDCHCGGNDLDRWRESIEGTSGESRWRVQRIIESIEIAMAARWAANAALSARRKRI